MKKPINQCAICGSTEKLTFEHIPPKSTFNNKPMFVQTADNVLNENSPLFGKKKRSPKGFGRHSLCSSCNNNTGSWYGNDFYSFIQQHVAILHNFNGETNHIRGNYQIKPLNVLKQICAMFMSTDSSGSFRDKGFTEFILDKDSQNLPSQFNIFIFSYVSPVKRFAGAQVVYDPVMGIQRWSEILAQPLGYLLTEQSQPAHELMVDISDFKHFSFGEEATIEITTSLLKPDCPVIGSYSAY